MSQQRRPRRVHIEDVSVKTVPRPTVTPELVPEPAPELAPEPELVIAAIPEKDVTPPQPVVLAAMQQQPPTPVALMPVEGMIHLRSTEDFLRLQEEYSMAVVCYTAAWCGACHAIVPLYERIAKRYSGRGVAFALVDIDVARVRIPTVPVFTAMHNGEEALSLEGPDSTDLKAFIKLVFQKTKEFGITA